MKTALFNIECLASSRAIEAILERHQDQIKILVTTDPNKGSLRVFLSQVFLHLRRSGIQYTTYLFLNFVLHPILVGLAYRLSRLLQTEQAYTPLKEICERHGIKYLRVKQVNSVEVTQALTELGIDLITVYYFDQILHERIIGLPKHGVINFHAAALPQCRGLHPIIFSAIKNDGKFAVTAHEITDRKIDAGAILGQTEIFRSENKNIFDLEEDVNSLGVDLYGRVVRNLSTVRALREPQVGGSYFSHPSRREIQELARKGYKLTPFQSYLKRHFVSRTDFALSATHRSMKRTQS